MFRVEIAVRDVQSVTDFGKHGDEQSVPQKGNCFGCYDGSVGLLALVKVPGGFDHWSTGDSVELGYLTRDVAGNRRIWQPPMKVPRTTTFCALELAKLYCALVHGSQCSNVVKKA